MEKASVIALFFCPLIIFSLLELSEEADILSVGGSVGDGETLVSSSQTFELGFFSPGKSNYKYLGIWFKNSPGAVVWVANRNNPIVDGKVLLTINDSGNLVLQNQKNHVIWSSNVFGNGKAENPEAQLLDTGNLVVKDNKSTSESYLWESFDHPSDTLLEGMKLGWNLKTRQERYLTSWKSADDPSPGSFTYRLDINGLPQLVLLRGSMKELRTGPWSGIGFGVVSALPSVVFKETIISNEIELYFTYEAVNKAIIVRLWLNQSGYLQWLTLKQGSGDWGLMFSDQIDRCNSYGLCGANSICSSRKEDICECLAGFIPRSQEGTVTNKSLSMNCVRESSINCHKGGSFLSLGGVKVPDFLKFQQHKSMSLRICEAECLKNCSCTAYANLNTSEGGSSCLMWFGDLIDVIEVLDMYRGEKVYIRLPASNPGSKHDSRTRNRLKVILLVPIISIAIISGLVFCIIWKRAKQRDSLLHLTGMESGKDETEVPFFNLSTVENATNNFSDANFIGRGGFGPVYKGTLPGGQEIAVKRLSKCSGQGLQEFKNEVALIAKLQHRNLVRLIGCSIQGDEKMLIYEYMPNKSLDYFIFDQTKSKLLDWRKRMNIIDGIALGLLYLHQDSRLRIIHRDLKTSNVLLDDNMNPKISDFGMARTIRDDQTEANTNRVVGTYGYMPPEYAVDGLFSVKSDVFSFGVLVLEILSGKKNRGFFHPDHRHNLVGHAWKLWMEAKPLELIDSNLGDSFVVSEVLRCIHVSLLCVQRRPKDRPNMPSVVLMLGSENPLPQPKQPGFFTERNLPESKSHSSSHHEVVSINEVTMSMLEAR